MLPALGIIGTAMGRNSMGGHSSKILCTCPLRKFLFASKGKNKSAVGVSCPDGGNPPRHPLRLGLGGIRDAIRIVAGGHCLDRRRELRHLAFHVKVFLCAGLLHATDVFTQMLGLCPERFLFVLDRGEEPLKTPPDHRWQIAFQFVRGIGL